MNTRLTKLRVVIKNIFDNQKSTITPFPRVSGIYSILKVKYRVLFFHIVLKECLSAP